VEPVLRGVHAGHDPELGGGERGDAEMDVHLPAGDEEGLDLTHVFADHDACDHGHQEVDSDDAAVQKPGEMGHVPLLR